MICGTATLTIVASTMIIATPRAMKNNPAHRRRDADPAAAAECARTVTKPPLITEHA
jgi:hypothetical protein